MNLGAALDKLALLERREKILSRRLDAAKKDRTALEIKVFDLMVGEGWEPNRSSMNRNGFRFRPVTQDYAVVQDADALREWLHGYDEGLLEDKFKQGELNRIVREKLDNNESLPPGLGSYTKTRVAKSGIMGGNDGEN